MASQLVIAPRPFALLHSALRAAFRPDQERDESGRWTDEGGGGGGNTDTGGRYSPRDREAHAYLKKRWARVNNALLKHADRPDSPAVQAKMNQLKAIVKEMYRLDADPGGKEGIGLPGGARDVVVIGAGPGGLAAGIMGGTDGLDTLVVDASETPGGQAKYSSRIENYPGFPVGVTGEKLTASMYEQAQRVGAETKLGVRVESMAYDESTGLKTLRLSNGETVVARSVVIAGGVEFRRLDLPGLDGSNVSYGDGKALANDAEGKVAVVVGGSNGAAQAALGAARKAKEVYVISRSPIEKGMSDYQVQALRHHGKIHVVEGDEIAAAKSDGGRTTELTTKSGKTIPCDGVGVFVGGVSKTDWLPSRVKRTGGKVHVDGNLETDIPGVFAVGDTRVGSVGRIGMAVGDGQLAVRNVWQYFDRAPQSRALRAAAAAKDVAAWDRLVDRLFALDAEEPFLGQSVDDDEELRTAADWNEADHPRDETGKFTDGGGGGTGTATPEFSTFQAQAMANLTKSSRTSSGVSDTSSSKDKPKLDVEGDALAAKVQDNTRAALSYVWQRKDDKLDARAAQDLIETVGRKVSDGLTTAPLYRSHDTKFNPVKATEVRAETEKFAAEFAARVDDPDPVATAAWVEQNFDGRIHPFTDGVGRSTKLLSAFVLARHGKPLPTYGDRKAYYEAINKSPQEFTDYYRGLFGSRAAAEWREEDHPRDDHGKFTESEGGTTRQGDPAAAPPPAPVPPEAYKGTAPVDPSHVPLHPDGVNPYLGRATPEEIKAGPASTRDPLPLADIHEAASHLGVPVAEIAAEAESVRANAQTQMEIDHAEAVAIGNLAARAATANGDSADLYKRNGRYSEERKKVHDEVIDAMFRAHFAKYGRLPEEGLANPSVTFLAGMPGAGKSTATKALDLSNTIVCDPDSVKPFMPGYNGVNAGFLARESGDIADKLMSFAMEHKMNVVVDGTAKSWGEPPKNIDDGLLGKLAAFKDSGYTTDVKYVDVNTRQSITRAVQRFVDGLKEYKASGYDPKKVPRWVELGFIKKHMFDAVYGTRSRRSFELAKRNPQSLDHYTFVDGWTQKVVEQR